MKNNHRIGGDYFLSKFGIRNSKFEMLGLRRNYNSEFEIRNSKCRVLRTAFIIHKRNRNYYFWILNLKLKDIELKSSGLRSHYNIWKRSFPETCHLPLPTCNFINCLETKLPLNLPLATFNLQLY